MCGYNCMVGDHDFEDLPIEKPRTVWCRRCGAVGIYQDGGGIAWRLPVYLGVPEASETSSLKNINPDDTLRP